MHVHCPLGPGCAAVCPVFMINFPVLLHLISHPGTLSLWVSPDWGRDPGWQLAGTLFSGLGGRAEGANMGL